MPKGTYGTVRVGAVRPAYSMKDRDPAPEVIKQES